MSMVARDKREITLVRLNAHVPNSVPNFSKKLVYDVILWFKPKPYRQYLKDIEFSGRYY
jgi:hypothetical protein